MAWLTIRYENLRTGKEQRHTISIQSDQQFLEFFKRIDTNPHYIKEMQINGEEIDPLPFITGIQGRG